MPGSSKKPNAFPIGFSRSVDLRKDCSEISNVKTKAADWNKSHAGGPRCVRGRKTSGGAPGEPAAICRWQHFFALSQNTCFQIQKIPSLNNFSTMPGVFTNNLHGEVRPQNWDERWRSENFSQLAL